MDASEVGHACVHTINNKDTQMDFLVLISASLTESNRAASSWKYLTSKQQHWSLLLHYPTISQQHWSLLLHYPTISQQHWSLHYLTIGTCKFNSKGNTVLSPISQHNGPITQASAANQKTTKNANSMTKKLLKSLQAKGQ